MSFPLANKLTGFILRKAFFLKFLRGKNFLIFRKYCCTYHLFHLDFTCFIFGILMFCRISIKKPITLNVNRQLGRFRSFYFLPNIAGTAGFYVFQQLFIDYIRSLLFILSCILSSIMASKTHINMCPCIRIANRHF